jgi:hypothetical protein
MHRDPGVVAKLAAAALLALTVLLAPGSVTTSDTLASGCPSGPVTVAKLVHVFESGPGGLTCYGGRLLTFRTFVAPLCDGCGGAEAAVVSPLWLDGLEGSSVIFTDGPGGSQMVAFVPPGLGECSAVAKLKACPFRSYYGRWVTVSAHYDGPVAQTCRYPEHPSGPGFSKADAILACRQELIVLSVGVGVGVSLGPGGPPDTATAAFAVATDRAGGLLAALPWVGTCLAALWLCGGWSRGGRSSGVRLRRPVPTQLPVASHPVAIAAPCVVAPPSRATP